MNAEVREALDQLAHEFEEQAAALNRQHGRDARMRDDTL
jgi:hypothetical protein